QISSIALLIDRKSLSTPLPKGRDISPHWGVAPPHTKTTVVVILEQIFSSDRSFCNFPDQ
ncbi:hypothetical protein, partial [Fischerella thermalis]|uniref:hypothetical protein n=1 Tax=Fischerella thermalis TaxID=372787 RepID=UPI001CA5B2C7